MCDLETIGVPSIFSVMSSDDAIFLSFSVFQTKLRFVSLLRKQAEEIGGRTLVLNILVAKELRTGEFNRCNGCNQQRVATVAPVASSVAPVAPVAPI